MAAAGRITSGKKNLRPAEGWQTIATARDWVGPAKLQNGTSFFYFATDQWRYEERPVDELVSPLAKKRALLASWRLQRLGRAARLAAVVPDI